MRWLSNGVQHIFNKHAIRISMTCIGHFQRNPGMSFLLFYQAFFDGKKAKNMIKFHGLFYSAKNLKKKKYCLQKQNACSIIKQIFSLRC